MQAFLRWGWIGAIALGIILVGAGIYMVVEGRNAHDDVRDTLADERIDISEDTGLPAGPVDSADEAEAQANVIREHVLETTGGLTYAELARDDPNRDLYLQSVTLRTALLQSYMAFKVSDLVSGVGIIVALLGGSHIALGAYLGSVVMKLHRDV